MFKYNELLHEHFHNPRCYGPLADPDFHVIRKNASCGDVVEVFGMVNTKEKILDKIHFQATGCMIATAAASLVCQALYGRSIAEAKMIDQQKVKKLLGDINLGPTRMRCAMLAADAIKEGVSRYA